MEEESYMVCMRVDELEDPAEGSTTTACVECGDDIWISAESRKELGRVGAMPVCSRCAARIARDIAAEELGMPVDGRLEEISKKMREIAIAEGKQDWLDVLDDRKTVDNFTAMKATAAMAAEEMPGPHGDWGSMAIMEGYDGHTFPPIPLSEMMRAGIPKDKIARQLLPAMVQAAHARRVIFGLSTWTLTGDSAKALKYEDGRIADHPDRKEAIVLIDVTADGVQQMSTAEIIRDGINKPKLGDWHDSENPAKSDGLFVDALVPTLQLVRTLHDS